MQSKVYHIAFAEKDKQAYLHFWGCNLACKGCECKKVIWDYMLDQTMVIHAAEPKCIATPPAHFMSVEEVVDTLERLGARWVLFEGQEASLDPAFPVIARELHRRLGAQNVLLTNAFEMPDVTDIDKVSVGFKAYDESLHRDYTGQSNKRIQENFKRLHQAGVKLSAETVLIPGYIDAEEIGGIARFIASVDPEIRLQIDCYFKAGDNPWRRATAADVEKAAVEARKYLKNVYFYTGNEPREYRVVSIFPTEAELAGVNQYEAASKSGGA